MTIRLICAIALAASPALGQTTLAPQIDCADPNLLPARIADCADMAWQEADEERDLAYRLALTQAQVIDEERALSNVDEPVGVEEALRQSQADWYAARDSACAAESLLSEAGPERRATGALCLERLTRIRIEELRILAEAG